MIISFLLYIAAFFLNIILIPIESLSRTLSGISAIDGAIRWLLGSLMVFNGIINIPALFGAINFVLSFIVTMFTFKIFFWLLNIIPWFRNVKNPFTHETRVTENSYDDFREREGYTNRDGARYTKNVSTKGWYKR